MAKIPKVNE